MLLQQRAKPNGGCLGVYLVDRVMCSDRDFIFFLESRLTSWAALLSHFFLASIQPTLSVERKKHCSPSSPSTTSNPAGHLSPPSCFPWLLLGRSWRVVGSLAGDWTALIWLSRTFWPSLQKSVSHRQAKIDPDLSSVMSFWLQSGRGTRGSLIDPNRTLVGKHSRSVAGMMKR